MTWYSLVPVVCGWEKGPENLGRGLSRRALWSKVEVGTAGQEDSALRSCPAWPLPPPQAPQARSMDPSPGKRSRTSGRREVGPWVWGADTTWQQPVPAKGPKGEDHGSENPRGSGFRGQGVPGSSAPHPHSCPGSKGACQREPVSGLSPAALMGAGEPASVSCLAS